MEDDPSHEREHGSIDTPWLTTHEAASYTRLSEATLERAVHDGLLPRGGTPGKRLFHTSWLDSFLMRLAGGEVLLALLLLITLLDFFCMWLQPSLCHWLHEFGLHHRPR